MCLMLYVATHGDLLLQKSPGMSVEEVEAGRAAVPQWFSLPVVRFIGAHTGCSCGFSHVMAEEPIEYWKGMFDGQDREADREKKHRGWPCKTSVPGSNPGGASNLYRGGPLHPDWLPPLRSLHVTIGTPAPPTGSLHYASAWRRSLAKAAPPLAPFAHVIASVSPAVRAVWPHDCQQTVTITGFRAHASSPRTLPPS